MFSGSRSHVWRVPRRGSGVIQRGHPLALVFVDFPLPLTFPVALFALPLPLPISLITTGGEDRRDVDYRAFVRRRRAEVDNLRGQRRI